MRAEPVANAVPFDELANRPESPPAIAPPPPGHPCRGRIAAAVAAVALGASFVAGYALYSSERRIPSAVGSTGTVSPGLRAMTTAAWNPSPPRPPPRPPQAEDRPSGAAPTRGVPGPAFSPSFTRDGMALLFHTGRSDDARSALMSRQVAGQPVRSWTMAPETTMSRCRRTGLHRVRF